MSGLRLPFSLQVVACIDWTDESIQEPSWSLGLNLNGASLPYELTLSGFLSDVDISLDTTQYVPCLDGGRANSPIFFQYTLYRSKFFITIS